MYLSHYSSVVWAQVRLAAIILTLGLSISAPQSTFAQNGNIWTAEYYNNPYLMGPATVTRQDTGIAFNWGASAPMPEVNADNFSVRWGADPYFEAGTYRFYTLADDNVRLSIDYPSQPQIDTFNNPSTGQIISVDVTMDAGVHHIQVDYREITGNAYVYVTWVNLTTNPTGPNFPVPESLPYVGSPWTVQYYANPSLTGLPTVTQLENTPSHYWGVGSPSARIASDNFSARWTSIQLLNAGNYQVSVRADDGVRVYIDGILYIDEWHTATGATYTTMVNIAAGQHNFQIDYYEADGVAFLDFNIAPAMVTVPPVVNPTSSATGIVTTTLRLNVRSEPTTSSNILVKINRNETYPVIGRNADSSWWQINVNGTIGWVYWRFLDVNDPDLVPIVSTTTGSSMNQPPLTGYFATALVTINIRSGPGTDNAILGQIARNIRVPIVGRTADNLWWQVNFGNITGWVSSRFMSLQQGTVLKDIPVTDYVQ